LTHQRGHAPLIAGNDDDNIHCISIVSMTVERIVEIDGGSTLLPDVLGLRHEVFVLEQGVPVELEMDDLDARATHLVAIRDGRVVGTLRILDEGGLAKIGRVAVRASLRRGGIGSLLMQRAAEVISGQGFSEIVLHAQVSVKYFYQRLGYVEEGDLFDEAGIPHISMRKRIAR
jgi:predicted GNAT family N-acyltransferase